MTLTSREFDALPSATRDEWIRRVRKFVSRIGCPRGCFIPGGFDEKMLAEELWRTAEEATENAVRSESFRGEPGPG